MRSEVLVVGLALGLALSGCTSDSSSPAAPAPQCNDNPWSCGSGKVCVEMDVKGATFDCVTSGNAKAGDPCQGYVATGECSEGMTCFLMTGHPKVCSPYCDTKDHPCPGGAKCIAALTQGGKPLSICEPLSIPPLDGGIDSDTPDAPLADSDPPDMGWADSDPPDIGWADSDPPDMGWADVDFPEVGSSE